MRTVKMVILALICSQVVLAQVDTECQLTPDEAKKIKELGILRYDEIKQMVSNNANNNRQISVNNTYAYYIDYRTLKFVAKALTEIVDHEGKPMYDGINLNFVTPLTKYKAADPDFQTKVSITPAKISGPKLYMYYSGFKNFYNNLSLGEKNYYEESEITRGVACNSICDSAVANWTTQGNLRKLIKLPLQENDITNSILFPTKGVLQGNISRYKSKHGNEHCTDCQTRSVFFEKWKIDLINRFIASYPEATFPIFAIYFLSYDKKNPELHQKDHRQTTIVFVPMAWQNGHHVPDPCSFIRYSLINYASIPVLKPKDINHGELCPDRCPEDGN